MDQLSYISNAHPSYIDSLYTDYKKEPASVDIEWRKFFDGFEFALKDYSNGSSGTDLSPKELKVWNLIHAYRKKGHLIADTNPIRPRKDRHAHLKLEDFGLEKADLDTSFQAGSEVGLGKATLKDIIAHLEKIYCGSIGIEYTYITDPEVKQWIKEKIETRSQTQKYDLDKKKRILFKLTETNVLEDFLSKKYVGQKRFSLEGGETTIPALDAIINKASELGTQEVLIGMAHRGRLNVLANILGKTYEQLFNEFEGNAVPEDFTMGDGDVKYHLGFTSNLTTTSGNKMHLQLAPNPSHLEAVDPVVQGTARAKLDITYDRVTENVLPIIIHGDSAIAGQGVVYELIQMAQLPGYYVGGVIHFVINNQVGFTTDFDDARSSNYCTSVAQTTDSPVLHVNGDDAESVVFAAELATEFRNKFKRDIFVDMVCYRKHGHNESDDPKFTQPHLYELISKHPNPRKIYINQLVENNIIDADVAKKMEKEFRKLLQDRLDMVKEKPLPYEYQPSEILWKSHRKATAKDFDSSPTTAIKEKQIKVIVDGITTLPEGFTPLRKVAKMLNNRKEEHYDKGKLDWASGELLAYGSILLDGHDIRMSGQDVKRGTFSHRHAMVYDEKTSKEYNRLNNLSSGQGRFMIYNSLLSEFAVLGFEFGYSISTPDTLTIWEAQFGDFANGAQTMIDQFIATSESKWNKNSGIVLLLPHGYEGQGPEHSSARLERFLQLCGDYNMTVANITSPANFFHALRRQLARPFRKPLIVMSPKSLLRHPKCISDISEIKKGGFKELYVDEFGEKDAAKIKKVLCCTGKIYYDLLEKQEELGRTDIVIVRLEQIYPLPLKQLKKVFNKYNKAALIWVQEEPQNMGAWTYILSYLRYLENIDMEVISRRSAASPATGFYKVHEKEQKELIERAFA